MVRPIKSGKIVDRRDQVLMGLLSFFAVAASTFFNKWRSQNGPFLIERDIHYPWLFSLLRRHADDPLDSLQRPALSDGYRASDSRPPCQSDVNYAHHCLLRQWLPGIQYARGGSRLNANAIAHNALLWLAASPMRPLNGRFARLCPAAFQYSESLYRPEYYEPATYSPLE